MIQMLCIFFLYISVQGADQSSEFKVAVRNSTGVTEQLYDNKGVTYGSGVFTVTLGEKAISAVVISRPDFNILTLCEVEVYTGEGLMYSLYFL